MEGLSLRSDCPCMSDFVGEPSLIIDSFTLTGLQISYYLMYYYRASVSRLCRYVFADIQGCFLYEQATLPPCGKYAEMCACRDTRSCDRVLTLTPVQMSSALLGKVRFSLKMTTPLLFVTRTLPFNLLLRISNNSSLIDHLQPVHKHLQPAHNSSQ